MKTHLLTALFITVLLTSCITDTKRKTDENETVPEAFQDESILKDVSSFKRGYESVTDKLYKELLEKDESLQALEETINKLAEDRYKNTLELNEFFSNNDAFYNEIKTQTETVKDTLLRDLLIEMINESEHYYRETTKETKTLKDILHYNVEVLNDYRTAMKIILTEQSMQQYQISFKQDTSMLHSLIQRYEQALENIQSKIEK